MLFRIDRLIDLSRLMKAIVEPVSLGIGVPSQLQQSLPWQCASLAVRAGER